MKKEETVTLKTAPKEKTFRVELPEIEVEYDWKSWLAKVKSKNK